MIPKNVLRAIYELKTLEYSYDIWIPRNQVVYLVEKLFKDGVVREKDGTWECYLTPDEMKRRYPKVEHG